MAQQLNDIRKLWTELYDGNHRGELETFLKDLETFKAAHPLSPLPAEWYRDVVVYSLYVDLFNESFEGLWV
jgi:maltose alpha-D-glucosyltransferase / alpha-amylase